MADEMIRMRTQNLPATDRELVNLAVEKSGATGAKRYAYAESVLRDIRPLKPEERGDVLGIMKAGQPFAAALASEKKELGKIRRRRRPLPKPRSSSSGPKALRISLRRRIP